MFPFWELLLDSYFGNTYNSTVRVIARRTLTEFSQKHPEVKSSLDTWYCEVKKENWKLPQDIMRRYPKCRIIENNRVIFNILHNKYRLIILVQFEAGLVYIRFVGTNKEYDKIKAEEV